MFCCCSIQFSGDRGVKVFYLGMGGLVIKKLSIIHFPLSIAHSGRKKLYLFNCISLRIQVAGYGFIAGLLRDSG